MRIICLVSMVFSYLFSSDFELNPIKIKDNSYYFYGKEEYFSKENHGNIANCSFIITKNSVILIDTGSSYEYGLELKREIRKITNKPIKYIINTHQHPDHFLGNFAFKNADIYASEYVKDEIEKNGKLYLNNIIKLIAKVPKETIIKVPNKILKKGTITLDNYELDIFLLSGHTKNDAVILDKNTKTLYTSDLIFNKRALATPHADLEKWISTLKKLKKLDFDTLVPGHGKMSFSKNVIDENIRYLEYLHKTLIDAVKNGLDIFDVLSQKVPKDISGYSMFEEEFERSIINLYSKYENKY